MSNKLSPGEISFQDFSPASHVIIITNPLMPCPPIQKKIQFNLNSIKKNFFWDSFQITVSKQGLWEQTTQKKEFKSPRWQTLPGKIVSTGGSVQF